MSACAVALPSACSVSRSSEGHVTCYCTCRFSDFEQDVWGLYNLEFGDQMGKSTGWQSLDEVYRVSRQCFLIRSATHQQRVTLAKVIMFHVSFTTRHCDASKFAGWLAPNSRACRLGWHSTQASHLNCMASCISHLCHSCASALLQHA